MDFLWNKNYEIKITLFCKTKGCHEKEDIVMHHVILIMPDNLVLQANLVLLFVLLLLEVLVFLRVSWSCQTSWSWTFGVSWIFRTTFLRYLLDTIEWLEQWGFPEWWIFDHVMLKIRQILGLCHSPPQMAHLWLCGKIHQRGKNYEGLVSVTVV